MFDFNGENLKVGDKVFRRVIRQMNDNVNGELE